MEQATPTLNMNTLPHYLLCSSISGLSMPAGSLSSMFPVTKLAHKTCPLGSNPFSAPSAASTVRGVKRKTCFELCWDLLHDLQLQEPEALTEVYV